MDQISILAVNMCQRNVAMHALLSSNVFDSILCIQEPWFNHIGVVQVDTKHEGRDVLRGAAHPNWDIYYPYFTNDTQAKVITYAQKYSITHPDRKTVIHTVSHLDLARHPTILITDHHVGKDCLHIINFYHDVNDPSSLQTLTSLDLDCTVPTIPVRDFNLYAPAWSPQGLPQPSQVENFEQWAVGQTFELYTEKGEITRRGREGEQDSTLDLTWHNFSASLNVLLTSPTINWEASLGSDHAGICSTWVLSFAKYSGASLSIMHI
jgi:hypothetical protein